MESPLPSWEETANEYQEESKDEHAMAWCDRRETRCCPTGWDPSMAGVTKTVSVPMNDRDTGQQKRQHQPDRHSREVMWQAWMASRGHSEGFWRARSVGETREASGADAADIDHCRGNMDGGSCSATYRWDTKEAVGEGIENCMEVPPS